MEEHRKRVVAEVVAHHQMTARVEGEEGEDLLKMECWVLVLADWEAEAEVVSPLRCVPAVVGAEGVDQKMEVVQMDFWEGVVEVRWQRC